ncbi:uncharacterized protein LOC125038695 [Penaeus chinensis]|uniref:uncharacterized protein LOC125038695 n=1 Tax=Penaeus chinensis TaxID=139456 RepID=UPI001FB5A79D|nr:uncharacterized protein LOC125038695 [Penaeus chinensis]
MENLSEDTGKECSENGGTEEGLSRLSNVYVTRPEPSEGTENLVNDVNVEENDQQNGGFVVEDDVLENILSESQRVIVENLRKIYVEKRTAEGISFKKVDKNKLKREINRVNQVIRHIETKNITETNELIRAATVWVAEQLGLKKPEFRAKKDPWWKRRIEDDIKRIRKDVNILERDLRGELSHKKSKTLQRLKEKYRVHKKGIKTVIEELKQRMIAKSAKIKRYDQRINQFRQNRTFSIDQKKIYKEMNGGEARTNEVPDAEESRRFWGDIWTVEKEHNKGAEWLSELKNEVKGRHSQEGVTISIENVRKQAKKMPNWKAPGKDGVQGYWIKNMTNMHDRIANQLNKILMGTDSLPKWLTHGRTVLCQKDPKKGNAVENYRPITCLPLMWKLMTGIIADQMYDYLEKEHLLPDEQKGCRRKSRGTKDQLLIDKTILKDCRKRHTNLAMAWIDYKKAYDFVPHSWISECMEMFGIAGNVREFLQRSMVQWKLSLTSNGEELGDVDVKRGIFQGDSLSPLLFVLSMIPLSSLLRKVNVCYEWGTKEYKLNHLLFMDDLKLYSKSEEQIDSLIQTTHIFSNDIGMEFGIKKCGVLVLKRGKIVRCEGIELPNDEIIKEVGQEGYTYLGIVELDKVKENEMKEKTMKEYKRRLRLILKSKLNGRNKITAINTWASDVDRLYIKRKEGGRGLISVEQCVKGEENSLGFYVANSEELLIRGVCASGTIQTEETMEKEEFKRRKAEELKQKWTGKAMYGQFVREMPEKVDRVKSWEWLSRSDLKVGTEAVICAAQEQAIRTNYVKHYIDKSSDSPLCRMCGKRGESIQHIVSECEKLAQKEYKKRHDNVAKKVHWDLCRKHGLQHSDKWYEHTPEGVVENEAVKILWDINVQLIGALGSVTKDLECWIENMDIVPEVGVLQKTALLGTARILRKVLEL